MTTSASELMDVEKEPASSVDTGRRSSFKLPAPLCMSDDILDRNVWSPNRRNSSIVANGELRSSNSPRTMHPLAPSQGSGGSNLGSPKSGTSTRFEDPLLSRPSFRRSVGSPSLEPVSTTGGGGSTGTGTGMGTGGTTGAGMAPTVLSPSFRAVSPSFNSFSARGSHIDFRRSVPGGSNVTSPAELTATARPSSARHPTLSQGSSDFANLDLGYASPSGGSELGGPGLDDEEVVDAEGDSGAAAAASHSVLSPRTLAQVSGTGSSGGGAPTRRHSAFVVHSPIASSRTGYISPAARLATRPSEDEEFMARLQHNRSSWRERPRTIGHGPNAASFGGSPAPCEGLQNQTHAALQQLRGELKSLSMRSMHGATATPPALSSPPPPLTGGTVPMGGGNSGGGEGHHAAATAATAGPGGVATGSSGGGGGGGGSAGGVSSLGSGIGRFSEGQAQLSPSRLSLSCHHYSISGGGDGAGGRVAPPELLTTCQSCPHGGPERHAQQMDAVAAAAAAAVQAVAVAHVKARFRAQAL